MSKLSGVLNIYKEKGYTSSDAVSVIRKALGYIKSGHTGTLDPQAEGVLPVCIGSATKIADYIGGVKSYRAELKLGITTDTDDLTGKILSENTVDVSKCSLEKAALLFLGETLQTPPMYSAVKIGGKKLYELARAGITTERSPRTVNISQINIIEYNPDTHTAIMDVTCSKGTYIRSLCADIGRALDCGGCMGSLVRTQAGMFRVSDSVTLGQLKEYAGNNRINELLLPIEIVLQFRKIIAPTSQEKRVINGNPISAEACINGQETTEGEMIFLTLNGNITGIYVRTGDFFKPRVMLFNESYTRES